MLLFYLILFLVPANLAKHFILPSSYVSGIMVDYLIPTVYLTDILIILLLVFKPVKKIPKAIIIFLLCLLPSVIFANSIIPALYKYIKITEMVLFGLWIYQYKHRISPAKVVIILSFSVLFQSLLALAQWFNQSSIFGYWFFGEQPYNTSTPGIDKITWFNGSLKIPPMGTFPHPNVLAGFLVISLTLILYQLLKGPSLKLQGQSLKQGPFLRSKAGPYWKFLLITSILGLSALFLTFSLSGWLAFLLIGFPLILQGPFLRSKAGPYWKFLMIYYGCLLIVLSLFGQNSSFLAPPSSFSRRSQLTQIAFKAFTSSPIAGSGLNNFTVVMDRYGYIPASTRFLQPVHNIYLLILSETGLVGLVGFIYLGLRTLRCLKVRNLLQSKVRPYWISLAVILFLGLFDHWPLTLQTGLLLTTYTIGLTKSKKVK